MFKVLAFACVLMAVVNAQMPGMPNPAEMMKMKNEACKHDITAAEEEAFKCAMGIAQKVLN